MTVWSERNGPFLNLTGIYSKTIGCPSSFKWVSWDLPLMYKTFFSGNTIKVLERSLLFLYETHQVILLWQGNGFLQCIDVMFLLCSGLCAAHWALRYNSASDFPLFLLQLLLCLLILLIPVSLQLPSTWRDRIKTIRMSSLESGNVNSAQSSFLSRFLQIAECVDGLWAGLVR